MEDNIRAHHETWSNGLSEEIAFWRHWFESRGGQIPSWREDYLARLDLNAPLQPLITDHLSAPPGRTVFLADVGAGPLTWLGKSSPGRTVKITAVDPLAEHYNRLIREFGITPPIRTETAEAERLLEVLPADHFDLAHARNALDHSYDPLTAIRQMVAVVKPGCYVVLQHRANEGQVQGYEGLHQWNFCVEDGQFIIWDRWKRIAVQDHLAGLIESWSCGEGCDNWFVVTMKKVNSRLAAGEIGGREKDN
jgi:SAM-dependent methyltransferase